MKSATQALYIHSPGMLEVCTVVWCHISRRAYIVEDMQGNRHAVFSYHLCEAANDPIYDNGTA